TIHAAGSELLALINDILDLSKIEAGKVELETMDLEIAEIAGYLERSFRAVAEQKGLWLSVSVDERLSSSIRTDVQRLQQILKNLLSNAFKFTSEGSVQVTISRARGGFASNHPILSVAEEVVQFAVRDTGIGIPPEKKQQIFDAFL